MSRAVVIERERANRTQPGCSVAMVMDYTPDHPWRPGITEMTPDPPGPPAVGTRVREVLKSGSRSYVTDSTVTKVGPGMTYRFSGSGTTGGVEGSRTVTSNSAENAVCTYRVELTLAGSYRFLRPVVGATMRRGLRSDPGRLRELLEHPDAPTTASD